MAPILRWVLPFILLSSSFAQLTFIRVDKPVVEKKVSNVPGTPMDRLHMLRAEFVKAGCPKVQEQVVPGEELPNVLCTVNGAGTGTIVISAPIQFKNEGDEAGVGWAGLVTLPLLTEALNSTNHQYTYVLAAFSGERGVAGSKQYLQQMLPVERSNIRAAVALSEIGRSMPKFALPWVEKRQDLETIQGRVVLGHAVNERDKSPLTRALEVSAGALKLSELPQEYDDIPNTEATVFSGEKIPAIAIHSMAYTSIPRVGGTEIKLQRTALDPKAYYDTYMMLSIYALLLDKSFEPKDQRREVLSASAQAPSATAPSAPANALTKKDSTPEQATSQKVADTGSTSAPSAPASPAVPTAPPVTPEVAVSAVPGQPTNSVPLFRKSVQLVQVDIVVTDKNGNPIKDLKQSDFTVLQDGVAREVRVFEPHSLATLAASQPPETRLPENTYTNLPNSGNDEARIILVFDMLNTPTQDQQYAQKQLVKVLREIPDGRRIAIFALSEKLTMLQGFTTDKQQLLAAADALSAERSHQYVGALQTQQSAGALAGLKVNTQPGISMPAQAGSQSVDPSVIGAPKSLPIREESSFLTSSRVEFTLDAFETLARAVSGYPGRKSVLWLSGGFPVAIAPDPELETATRGAENYREQLARTSKLLATSRIAMYPIDVRGIQPRGVDISLSTAETEGLLEMRQPANNHVGTGGTLETNSGLGNLLNQQSRTYSYERSTLLNVAYDTGGRAFIGSNNIKQAIARGMEDSAVYYTLAYSPDPNETKLSYHKIEVKVARPDVKLTYRRGYYAIPQPAAGSADSAVAVLRGSLQPGMPPATSLYLTAKVSPPPKPGQPLKIDYVINPNGVTFADAEKGSKHALVDCMAVAFDLQGREIAHASDTLDATIPAEQYDWVMRRGLPANQEIALKPGTYNLRIGVMDRSTQQIGTLDVPVTIPAN